MKNSPDEGPERNKNHGKEQDSEEAHSCCSFVAVRAGERERVRQRQIGHLLLLLGSVGIGIDTGRRRRKSSWRVEKRKQ
jgi:hypothetical protein